MVISSFFKKNKALKIILIFTFLLLFAIIASVYVLLLLEGKQTYDIRTKQVNTMIAFYPSFFESVFSDVFPHALQCSDDRKSCKKQIRDKFDNLSASVTKENMKTNHLYDNFYFESKPFNQQPVYFIKLVSDNALAKLFFSGDVIIEDINTREEKMVIALLKGKRNSLYGPYFNQEAFISTYGQQHPFYDLKPAYLKDLYAQMEVIVPYYQDGELIGAIVYLHGE